MPSTTPPVDSKSRQSSGGRSFFGRKLYKEKVPENRGNDDGNSSLDISSAASSISGSRSSRHANRQSVASIDTGNALDVSGLATTAGVIASIPYDSVSMDGRTPIPVDYLPRSDQVPRRKEPLPHHLNKGGGDFHQYPAWEGQTLPPNGAQYPPGPTGPRPPPHASQLTLTSPSRDRSVISQPSGRPGTASSAVNGTHGAFISYSTTETSTNPRNSFDQSSVFSSGSSVTRGSMFSMEHPSRTAIPSQHQDSSNRPNTSSRQSNHHFAWQSQQPSGFNSTTSFAPEGFTLPRPSDERVIEEQFEALMYKRGWQHLPEQARRQMQAYPASKKWTLIHQDKLTEWQGEQKRRTHARQTMASSDGSPAMLARADEEGSPEWYVKKVMNDSIDMQQLGSLIVILRTQPVK
ncbi:hypothetical protein MMC12_003398 [Toensbergia leucococca]|nr:hypothetical protein [Toensbergia leucococca]